jgi:FlaA1/EpsC-like NDP-sugar epimerase
MTDPDMTRFVMTTDRAVELALEAAHRARGGEVFVFKMPVARLGDLVAAAIDVYAPRLGRTPRDIEITRIPQRPGEKPYEELMTEDEASRAYDVGDMYAVLPALDDSELVLAAYAASPSAPVRPYRSDAGPILPVDDVRAMIAESADRSLA